MTVMQTTLSPEDQEALMRWPYEYKIPIFPADTINKTVSVKQWSTTDFSKVDFRAEMLRGAYDNGAAARLGQTLEEGLYSIALDFDGWDAVVAWFGSWDNVLAHSKKSPLVEWHQDQGKIHVILFAHEPLPKKKMHIGKNKVLLEIRCEKQILFISPSRHKDGNNYAPLGTSHIETLHSESGLLQLKAKINQFSDRYMSDDDKARYDAWLDDPNTILGEGAGRHTATLHKARSYFWKYAGEWLNLSDSERFDRAWQWHMEHCQPPRSGSEFENICKWVIDKDRVERDKKHELIREERRLQEEAAQQHYKTHSDNKKAILESITNKQIRNMLDADIWTMVSENPAKFIIARRKACHICRASISYSDSGNNQATKKAHLNYGSILIRLYPKTIILHESPLKFLETSERYTIVFENQDRHEVIISGTIEGIISRLKEMPGYVVSSYGIAEALNSIIGAFKDDDKLLIDKTVEFEGYYYADNDVQISKINLDEKHPRRTKQEVIDCIKYLSERSDFQIWKDKQGNTIDRRDLLASLIQWLPASPFNFVLKQQNCKPYLKGFAMTGERDGAKSSLSEEILNAHGNPTNEQDADSIYSVSAGSVNTEAKFGKAVSKTTYAVEFSEFGRVESYGRHEDLVECFKTSVDATIVRRGKKENRNDAPFPSLSPLIINGNPPFTSKGELLKRYHVAKFSEEDRHDRSPNSPFNTFQRENKHHWKTLGDWTLRYILDNKQELLLSKKYGAYEIGKLALKAFYEFGGLPLPEWLTGWITDTSLEELDQDVEGLIRSILYNHVHKTIRENSFLINKDGMGDLTVSQRIEECLKTRVWPWIRKLQGEGEKYHINSSVMELFSIRLPDLTLKKLAEKTGFQYVKDGEGRAKILCTKKQLDDFIAIEDEIAVKTYG
jgi:hypothetical protein